MKVGDHKFTGTVGGKVEIHGGEGFSEGGEP